MLKGQEAARTSIRTTLSDLMVLFKLRVVLLLLLSATAGAFLGAHGRPAIGPMLLLLVTGTLTAMGSSAWNQYLERTTDALMTRTRSKRPLVTGAIPRPGWVPPVATAMIAVPVLAVLPFNPALALYLALGAFIYVVIYTLWLKPRTTLNIVIGGAAGSAAVLSGGAAVSASNDPAVISLAVLLFFWTPIHFWSLALVYREDYARANVPMLPVATSARTAALWALVHGVGVGIAAVALALTPGQGPVYAMPMFIATAALLWLGGRLVAGPTVRRAAQLFHASNFYLALLLLAIMLNALFRVPWPF